MSVGMGRDVDVGEGMVGGKPQNRRMGLPVNQGWGQPPPKVSFGPPTFLWLSVKLVNRNLKKTSRTEKNKNKIKQKQPEKKQQQPIKTSPELFDETLFFKKIKSKKVEKKNEIQKNPMNNYSGSLNLFHKKLLEGLATVIVR